jgi:polyvinyl alcohol dehydrogenase (cytochrome)
MTGRKTITSRAGAALLGCSLALSAGGTATATGPAAAARTGSADWTMAGQNIDNTRDQPLETTISPANVAGLTVKWSLTTNGDVLDTPAVSNGVLYLTDHGSSARPSTLWAVNASTGSVIWSHSVASYTGLSGDTSRSTPTVSRGLLILGDVPPLNATAGTWLIAVNATNGSLVWKTHLDPHPAAVTTSSPVVYGSTVIVGVSSQEETLALKPGYPCCTFRGSVVALNASTGHVLWKTYMTPSNGGKAGGYSGAAVWGSTPVVDASNSLVYIGTGNNYTAPAGVCTTPGATGCAAPASNDYADSIVALSLVRGAVIWVHPTLTADVATDACIGLAACGPDLDFGCGANLYPAPEAHGGQRQLLGIGQKSGVYYALDPSTGQTVWQAKVGPGTQLGGIEFGSATDGNRVYVAESDFTDVPYTANGKTITGGSWAALNAATGAIEWRRPDPQGAADPGFMSVANGVVYAPSSAGSGSNMYALNAATGAIDWSYASGGSVLGGAAIANGTVYWGSGYTFGTENNKLYAFASGRRDAVRPVAP